MMHNRRRVYVAGPYSGSKSERANNLSNAIAAAEVLRDHGFLPFVPHLWHHWDTEFPSSRETWLDMGKQWLEVCDVVFVISESPGVMEEIEFARACGIPVFHSLTALIDS